jgi:E3 ubiquitin-protein ligase BRE1
MRELNNKNDETEYELEKISDKAFKLDRQLAETLIKYQKLNNSTKNNSNETTNSHSELNGHSTATIPSSNNYLNKNLEKQISELEAMLEEHRELASSRLQELEKINLDYQLSLKQIEKLKSDLKTIPESVIEQSSEFKYLQTKYSLIVNDNMKLRQAFDETRNLLEMSRLTFQRQLEQMESEELANQKKLGSEMMHMEEQLATVRKENELLRIEYEQNIAANEQTGPINKEMRSLITTLQANNKLLKSDIARTKKRLEEAQQEIERYKKQNSQLQSQLQHNLKKSTHYASSEPTTTTQKGASESNNEADEKKDDDSNDSTGKKEENKLIKNQDKHQQSPLKSSNNDSEATKTDRSRLREALEKNKKPSNSTIASPSSLSSTTHQVSSSTGNHVGDEHSNTPTSSSNQSSSMATATPIHSSESHYKKIRQLEDQVRDLHKNLSNKKQEEAALLNDMEITGQAFEDMQVIFYS